MTDCLAFRITLGEAAKTITVIYGYARSGGKWVERAYDLLSWERHHDRETFGEVRCALIE